MTSFWQRSTRPPRQTADTTSQSIHQERGEPLEPSEGETTPHPPGHN
jgi:hypothetical protein